MDLTTSQGPNGPFGFSYVFTPGIVYPIFTPRQSAHTRIVRSQDTVRLRYADTALIQVLAMPQFFKYIQTNTPCTTSMELAAIGTPFGTSDSSDSSDSGRRGLKGRVKLRNPTMSCTALAAMMALASCVCCRQIDLLTFYLGQSPLIFRPYNMQHITRTAFTRRMRQTSPHMHTAAP